MIPPVPSASPAYSPCRYVSPTCGSPGTITPANAPSTPCSHDPPVETTSPFSYSLVVSPRYHTFPHTSCAYQSNVFSTSSPRSLTTSWTTVASMPSMSLVRSSTVTVTRCDPSKSNSRDTHRVPGAIGQ